MNKTLIATALAAVMLAAPAAEAGRHCKTRDLAGVWRYVETFTAVLDNEAEPPRLQNCWIKIDRRGNLVGIWDDVLIEHYRSCEIYANWWSYYGPGPDWKASVNKNCAGVFDLNGGWAQGHFQLSPDKTTIVGTGFNWDWDGPTQFQMIKSDRLSRMNWQGPKHAR